MENDKQQENITIDDLASVPGGESLSPEQMQGVEGSGLASSPLGATAFLKIDGVTALNTSKFVKY